MKKNILRAIAFFLLLSCVLGLLNWVFVPKNYVSGASTPFYRELPEESVDVIYSGASGLGCGISPTAIWAEFGITGYNISTPLQMSITTYYTLLEALEYQTPKILVLDAGMLLRANNVDDPYFEPSMRRAITTMHMSDAKIQAILDIVDQSEKQTVFSYFFPLLGFHSRWSSLSADDFKTAYDPAAAPYLGNFNYTDTVPVTPLTAVDSPDYIPPDESADTSSADSEWSTVNPSAEVYFKKIFEICDQKGITVILEKNPSADWTYEKHCSVSQFAAQHNIMFVDYNTSEYLYSVNLNYDTDFSDSVHVNIHGSYKISLSFGRFLQQNFDLADNRNTPGYEIYNEYASQYLSNISKDTASDN